VAGYPSETRWVARLTPLSTESVNDLLLAIGGLDVWERHPDTVVVAASEALLTEVERRGLARVERLATVAEFLEQTHQQQDRDGEGRSSE